MKDSHPKSVCRREGSGSGSFLKKYWLIMFVVLIAAFFGIQEERFFSIDNIRSLFTSACVSSIIGIGLTCIMSTGELDFSAGTSMTMGAVLISVICKQTWVNSYAVGFVLTILCLVVIGLLNAVLHVKIGIPSIIATMGTSYLFSGIARALCHNTSIFRNPNWPSSFTFLGQGYLFGVIPMPVVCLVLVAALTIVYTQFSRAGQYLYLVGNNPKACEYLGISPARQKTEGFVLCAVLCGFGGILQASMLNGTTCYLGDDSLLPAVITIMLGCTFLNQGRYNVAGTIVGAILIAAITNGLTMMGAPAYIKEYALTVILLAAVSAVAITRQKRVKAL